MSVTVNVKTGKVKREGADAVAHARASMRASPAQVRRALHRLGRLAEVNAIAAADAEAAIVWEYATVIERRSPFITALGAGAFTDEEIDVVFDLAVTL